MRIFLVRWQIYDKSLIIYQALDELDRRLILNNKNNVIRKAVFD
jgi:hypothetical protein